MSDLALRSFGLSLLFIGMAIGSLSRTMHVSDSTKMALTTLSILCSVAAVVLFIKAAPARRRPAVIGLLVGAALAAAVVAWLFTHR